jgi:hypothetical protein
MLKTNKVELSRHEKGFSTVEILFLIVVIVLGGAIGYVAVSLSKALSSRATATYGWIMTTYTWKIMTTPFVA